MPAYSHTIDVPYIFLVYLEEDDNVDFCGSLLSHNMLPSYYCKCVNFFYIHSKCCCFARRNAVLFITL